MSMLMQAADVLRAIALFLFFEFFYAFCSRLWFTAEWPCLSMPWLLPNIALVNPLVMSMLDLTAASLFEEA